MSEVCCCSVECLTKKDVRKERVGPVSCKRKERLPLGTALAPKATESPEQSKPPAPEGPKINCLHCNGSDSKRPNGSKTAKENNTVDLRGKGGQKMQKRTAP